MRRYSILDYHGHSGSHGSILQVEESQKDLMQRTAKHLYSSPNPAQLEMRILANHGADKRFAFLRGRWSRTWQIFKGKARMANTQQDGRQKPVSGLDMLADYADSDDSDAEPESPHAEALLGAEAELQEARRARAKEWAAKRRQELQHDAD